MAEKQLESTVAAAEYQKAWFAELRRDVFENRKPYAIVQADMPLELFQAMEVPTVSNQWFAAITSAKRLSPFYLDSMNAKGFHEGLCRYCSLPLASTLCAEVASAPWGGLPRPALIAARLTCDCIQRVFGIWSEAFGTEFIALDAPGASELPPRWWELSRYRWRELFEEHRLDFMVTQFRRLIESIERITSKKFDLERLRSLMEGVNRQEEYFEEVRDLMYRAPDAGSHAGTGQQRHGGAMASRVGLGHIAREEISR